MSRSSTRTEPGAGSDAGRISQLLTVLLALLAVACLTTAWLLQRTSNDDRAAAAGNVPAALASNAPHRDVIPVKTAAPSGRPTPTPTPAAKPKSIYAPLVPQQLYVPAIKVNTKIIPKPTELDHDPFLNKTVRSFGVPDDMYTTTWWSSGPRPGAHGMAVILGHTQIGAYGVFNNLAHLEPHDVIGVIRGGTTLRFVVEAVHTGISKKDPTALETVLSDHPSDARLALLTCSGHFNQSYRESAENTVVFARLVSVSH